WCGGAPVNVDTPRPAITAREASKGAELVLASRERMKVAVRAREQGQRLARARENAAAQLPRAREARTLSIGQLHGRYTTKRRVLARRLAFRISHADEVFAFSVHQDTHARRTPANG